jgi:hypothetical protein
MSIEIEVRGPFLDVVVKGVLAVDDLGPLLGAMRTARENGPFVMLTDTLKMKSGSAGVLPEFSEGLKRMPSLKGIWLGDAVVVASPVAQFALSTLLLLAPLPTEMKVFSDRSSALEWCHRVLHVAGRAIESRRPGDSSSVSRGSRW